VRIVFIGASELGWECCRVLFERGQNIVGILSAPREFRISWSPSGVTNVRHRSFDDLAAAHDVPLRLMTTKMRDSAEWIAGLHPDLLVVAGWYHLIPKSMLANVPLGAVGLHNSLLPRYRGGAPLVWSIINGESETGVTLFYLADGVDDGDIVGQQAFPIAFEDTIADVVRKAIDAAVDVVARHVPEIALGAAPRIPQDHATATTFPQRGPEDGLLDWNAKSARQAYDWVRAQTRPYPGAFTWRGSEKLTIWRASLLDEMAVAPPGTFVREDAVVCADQRLLRLDEVSVGYSENRER